MNQKQGLAQRLKVLRDHFGHTQQEMAVFVGGKLRSWQDYEAGRSAPSAGTLASLAMAGVNINWVLTGAGGMLHSSTGLDIENPSGAAFQEASEQLSDDILLSPGLSGSPRYRGSDAASCATGPAAEVLVQEEEVCGDVEGARLACAAPSLARHLSVDPQNLAVISVHSDSMAPTLLPGDLVVLDLSWTKIRDEGLYAFRSDTGALIKRVEHRLDGRLLIRSDNSSHTSELIEPHEAAKLPVCGRVVYLGKKTY
jgi:phage repressor protein C with HTH and peptisase S24 domain